MLDKRKKRRPVCDLPIGSNELKSSMRTAEQEAVTGAFPLHLLRSFDDCPYALQPTMRRLTCSSGNNGSISIHSSFVRPIRSPMVAAKKHP
jgi:hypothetical protein